MTGRLEGKVAIVNGAGSVGPGWGNGRASAVLFAQEGARVFAVDRSLENLEETLARIREFDGDVTGFEADATDADSVEAMVTACQSEYGAVDVLMNVVGGSAAGGAVDLSIVQWEAQLEYNLTSVFIACKTVLPIMVEQGKGSIVNVASTSGIRWTGSAQVGYAASKAGIIQLSRVTAVQYAPHGVRVNTVVPGQLHTPMVEARLAGQRVGGDVDALLAQRLARIPLGFAGDGRDTAYAALYFASDESRFVTGTEIIVDGGMSVRCD